MSLLPILLATTSALPWVLPRQAAAAPAPDGPEAVEGAVTRGLAFLIAAQELDGSWRFENEAYPGGQTALALYTLIESGVRRAHPTVLRAATFLETAEPGRTYSTACLILALEALDAAGNAQRIADLAEQLLAWQRGGFGYPEGLIDLSNTQYAALALRAAARAGFRVPNKAWSRIGESALALETADGGFAYRAGQRASGAMTAAGVAILLITRDALAAHRALPRRQREALAESIQGGIQWLDRHFAVELSPKLEREGGRDHPFVHYYLHGLERVGTLAKLERIGSHDWYAEGVTWLLAAQQEDGRWTNTQGAPEPTTCFALLFLERATAARSGRRGRGRRQYGSDSPANAVSLLAVGDSPLTLWISSFGADARSRYEWEGERGAGLRVARVEYLDGDDVVAEVPGDASTPCGSSRFATQVRFDEPGMRAMWARVHIVPPGGDAADAVVLESPTLAVPVTEALADWMLEYARDPTRNLLSRTTVDAHASSQLDDTWAPRWAVDGLQTRGWLCANEDEEPTLVLELAKSQRGNVLLFSMARGTPLEERLFAQPEVVDVIVNGLPPVRVSVDQDEQRKTRVELGRAVSVRRIELRIVARTPGRSYAGATGFMEVELQDRR
ncbi:MAG: hypothetical protein E2O39_01465 [Planctomycetota bacterium]|nr:MAG: hypothetical protein E2O39_01465 [Planctomycetota bacterium]